MLGLLEQSLFQGQPSRRGGSCSKTPNSYMPSYTRLLYSYCIQCVLHILKYSPIQFYSILNVRCHCCHMITFINLMSNR